MMRLIKAGWRCFDAPIATQRLGLMREIVSIAARMTTWGQSLQGVHFRD